MEIRIRNRNFAIHWLDVEQNDTIKNLRLKIANREGLDSDSFSLFYYDKELEDNRTLA